MSGEDNTSTYHQLWIHKLMMVLLVAAEGSSEYGRYEENPEDT